MVREALSVVSPRRCSPTTALPIDEIARLVGHSSSAVTELVYRQQIRPVVQSGAVIMDRIFDVNEDS